MTHDDKSDRFLSFFEQSMKETEYIYDKIPFEKIYEDISGEWRFIHKTYQANLKQLKSSKPNITSQEIGHVIQFIGDSIVDITIQKDAIRQHQHMLFDNNNRTVFIPACKSDHYFKDSILC